MKKPVPSATSRDSLLNAVGRTHHSAMNVDMTKSRIEKGQKSQNNYILKLQPARTTLQQSRIDTHKLLTGNPRSVSKTWYLRSKPCAKLSQTTQIMIYRSSHPDLGHVHTCKHAPGCPQLLPCKHWLAQLAKKYSIFT